MPKDFTVKDSGERMKFDSGMVRDLTTGKIKWHLIRSGPMHERWAVHLTKGAEKYGDDNWLKANGPEELKRFKESADRHFNQWIAGETDEDHAAAVFFNINGAEYVEGRLAEIRTHEPARCTSTYAVRHGGANGVSVIQCELPFHGVGGVHQGTERLSEHTSSKYEW